eukprot:CFRG7022T1
MAGFDMHRILYIKRRPGSQQLKPNPVTLRSSTLGPESRSDSAYILQLFEDFMLDTVSTNISKTSSPSTESDIVIVDQTSAHVTEGSFMGYEWSQWAAFNVEGNQTYTTRLGREMLRRGLFTTIEPENTVYGFDDNIKLKFGQPGNRINRKQRSFTLINKKEKRKGLNNFFRPSIRPKFSPTSCSPSTQKKHIPHGDLDENIFRETSNKHCSQTLSDVHVTMNTPVPFNKVSLIAHDSSNHFDDMSVCVSGCDDILEASGPAKSRERTEETKKLNSCGCFLSIHGASLPFNRSRSPKRRARAPSAAVCTNSGYSSLPTDGLAAQREGSVHESPRHATYLEKKDRAAPLLKKKYANRMLKCFNNPVNVNIKIEPHVQTSIREQRHSLNSNDSIDVICRKMKESLTLLNKTIRPGVTASCFTGRDFMEWAMLDEDRKRSEVIDIGNLLVLSGMIWNTSCDEQKFKEDSYFAFTVDCLSETGGTSRDLERNISSLSARKVVVWETVTDVLHDVCGVEAMYTFLNREYCEEILLFCTTVENFKEGVDSETHLEDQALEIYNTFIQPGAKLQVNIAQALLEDIQAHKAFC